MIIRTLHGYRKNLDLETLMLSLNVNIHAMPMPDVKKTFITPNPTQFKSNGTRITWYVLERPEEKAYRLLAHQPCIDALLEATAPPSHSRTVFIVGFLGS